MREKGVENLRRLSTCLFYDFPLFKKKNYEKNITFDDANTEEK